MPKPTQRTSGFTIVEVIVASSLLIVTITLAMSGLVYLISETTKSSKQAELDIEVQIAMERLKRDLRLSSLDHMYYVPAGQGPYTGISFPLATDSNGDGILDVDADGKLVWGQQLVYHVWVGSPNQLRVTTFDNRDNSLTDSQRLAQLTTVVNSGSGAGAPNGTNSASVTIFENLFEWRLSPLDAVFDGYASSPERSINVNLGSLSMSNGTHTLRFTVADKNDASSGYRLGIDALYASPSYSVREGEDRLPVSAQSGATATKAYITSGSWSGNYDLDFNAQAIDDYVEITLYNDLWRETNFRATGETHDETEVEFDTTLSPSDFTVQLTGNETNWTVTGQTGAASGYSSTSNEVSGCAIRVLIRGEEMDSGNWISSSGGKCTVAFSSGDSDLHIRDAYIAEASSSESNTVDSVAGTQTRLEFAGAHGIRVHPNSIQWSDLTDFSVDKSKSYLVSYLVSSANDRGCTMKWDETYNSSFYGTSIIPASSTPGDADTKSDTWSGRGDVLADNTTYGVKTMYVTYVTNGIYTSSIFDTRLGSPSYNKLAWTADTPTGSSISFKVRSSADSTLSNATAWASLSTLSTSGTSISPGNGRYLQFQATLTPTASQLETPKLQDVTIDWPAAEQFVDIGGTFSKGSDYGIFELTVDGKDIKKGLQVDLEIYDFVRAHGAKNRITSRLLAEIYPRNTGK